MNIGHPKRKLVFQPSNFRCELLVSGRVVEWSDCMSRVFTDMYSWRLTIHVGKIYHLSHESVPNMSGVWLWLRLAWAVAMVSWCNLLTSMGVIGTTNLPGNSAKKWPFWVLVSSPSWPKHPFWRIVDQTQHRYVPTRKWKGHGSNHLVVGFLRHVFLSISLQWSFHISKYRENAEVARQKR